MRRWMVVLVVVLVGVVIALSVQLYRTKRQLDLAERYMVSGTLAWASVCVRIAGDLQRSSEAIRWLAESRIKDHCLAPDDVPTFKALVEKGEVQEAILFVNQRAFAHRLPRLLPHYFHRGSYPAGYVPLSD